MICLWDIEVVGLDLYMWAVGLYMWAVEVWLGVTGWGSNDTLVSINEDIKPQRIWKVQRTSKAVKRSREVGALKMKYLMVTQH